MLNYNSFTLKNGFVCHPQQFFTVINAIPSGVKMLMRCSLSYSKITAVLPSLYVGDTNSELRDTNSALTNI